MQELQRDHTGERPIERGVSHVLMYPRRQYFLSRKESRKIYTGQT